MKSVILFQRIYLFIYYLKIRKLKKNIHSDEKKVLPLFNDSFYVVILQYQGSTRTSKCLRIYLCRFCEAI
jgi:hypothetical protein